eukprot:1137660-Pelagomonas_calceolata.AAC.5
MDVPLFWVELARVLTLEAGSVALADTECSQTYPAPPSTPRHLNFKLKLRLQCHQGVHEQANHLLQGHQQVA